MAAYVELYLDQGATFNSTVNIMDDLTNTPVNVATLVVTSQLKKSILSKNPSANVTCTVTDAANGEITLSMSHLVTANLTPGRYFFDVKSFEPMSNVASRILEGVIHVSPQVTK